MHTKIDLYDIKSYVKNLVLISLIVIVRIQIRIQSVHLEFAIKCSNNKYDKQIFC